MNLHNVKVGQQVWSTYRKPRQAGYLAAVGLATITHIDKSGRLYICSENHEAIKTGNWRYGFDPATGTSKYTYYNHIQLAYATPKGIAAWTAAKEAKLDAKEGARREERRKAIFARNGEALYLALKGECEAGDVLLTIDEELLEEFRQWEQLRSDYRKSERSQTTMTWDDLPRHFYAEAINQ